MMMIIMLIWLFQPHMLYAILYNIVMKLVVTRLEYFIVPNPYYIIILYSKRIFVLTGLIEIIVHA